MSKKKHQTDIWNYIVYGVKTLKSPKKIWGIEIDVARTTINTMNIFSLRILRINVFMKSLRIPIF